MSESLFDKEKFIQNSFTVVFNCRPDIRREANKFEDRLKDDYVQPQIFGVPDNLEPEIPRMIFGSKHGYSHIIFSQMTMTLNVIYSPDWQSDIRRGQTYLLNRAMVLFDLLDLMDEKKPFFCGLTTRVQIPSSLPDADVLSYLEEILLSRKTGGNVHDFELKEVAVHEDKYFSNVLIQNYRIWEDALPKVMRLSRKNSITRGIQIIGDFNDRYAFNEEENYYSSKDSALAIIEKGITFMIGHIERMKGNTRC